MASNEFLKCLRDLTTQYGSLLIFDEVMTGFRHGLGGYQSLCRVLPDLTAMGKAIANGFRLTAIAGPADLLRQDQDLDVAFRWGLVDRGVFSIPRPLKRNHISLAHTAEGLPRTLDSAEDTLTTLASRRA